MAWTPQDWFRNRETDLVRDIQNQREIIAEYRRSEKYAKDSARSAEEALTCLIMTLKELRESGLCGASTAPVK